MIYVIYEWSVHPDNHEEFLINWSATTQAIHANVKGALGSFCLGCCDDPTVIKTIAKWDSLELWQSFIKTADTDSMKNLHDIAKLNSSTAHQELGNHLK